MRIQVLSDLHLEEEGFKIPETDADVIVLAGDRYASRMGASILTRLQLEGFVADTKEAYLQSAIKLATNWDALQELRLGMRKRFISSPIYDVNRFTHEMEYAFREIWHVWCRGETKKR